MNLACFVDAFVPVDEEALVLVSDVSELPNPQLFHFSFNVGNIVLTIFVLGLGFDLLEDVEGVVVLLLLFCVPFAELGCNIDQKVLDPFLQALGQKVAFALNLEIVPVR